MPKLIAVTLIGSAPLDVGDMFECLNAEAKAGGITIT